MATYNVIWSSKLGSIIKVNLTGGDGQFQHVNVNRDNNADHVGEVSSSHSGTALIHMPTTTFNEFWNVVSDNSATVTFTPEPNGDINSFGFQN